MYNAPIVFSQLTRQKKGDGIMKGIFKRVKNWWNSMSENDQTWVKAVAIWTLDGVVAGSIVTSAIKNGQRKKAVKLAQVEAYNYGMMDAYRDMLERNPYMMMDQGMKKLDKQGKVTKF